MKSTTSFTLKLEAAEKTGVLLKLLFFSVVVLCLITKNTFKVDYITLHVICKSVVCHRNMYCIA